MTVIAQEAPRALLIEVDHRGQLIRETTVPRLNADLSAHADVATSAAVSLRANEGLSAPGFKLHGRGFILAPDEAAQLIAGDARNGDIIRPYRNGKDLTARPRCVSVIDFGLLDEVTARGYPTLFDIVRDRVKPERDANSRAAYTRFWWRYGEPRRDLRAALAGLTRCIATVETSKHRFFQFLDIDVAPDNKVVVVASDDAFVLGTLSSAIHQTWALAAGGRLGVGNDPVYVKSTCFDSFPFPSPNDALRYRISALAERLAKHRADALARDERVTMTGMYNVVEKLRSGAELTKKEREVHTLAACGVLRDLHDELDALVAEAYGWEWPLGREAILERLVALHDARVEEEKRGVVRWLRPEYQIPRFGAGTTTTTTGPMRPDCPSTDEPEPSAAPVPLAPGAKPAWPPTVVAQITALKALAEGAPVTADEAAAAFVGAKRAHVARLLDTLAIMGELQELAGGRYRTLATAT